MSAVNSGVKSSLVNRRLTAELLIKRERHSTLLNIKKLEMPRQFDQAISTVMRKTFNGSLG